MIPATQLRSAVLHMHSSPMESLFQKSTWKEVGMQIARCVSNSVSNRLNDKTFNDDEAQRGVVDRCVKLNPGKKLGSMLLRREGDLLDVGQSKAVFLKTTQQNGVCKSFGSATSISNRTAKAGLPDSTHMMGLANLAIIPNDLMDALNSGFLVRHLNQMRKDRRKGIRKLLESCPPECPQPPYPGGGGYYGYPPPSRRPRPPECPGPIYYPGPCTRPPGPVYPGSCPGPPEPVCPGLRPLPPGPDRYPPERPDCRPWPQPQPRPRIPRPRECSRPLPGPPVCPIPLPERPRHPGSHDCSPWSRPPPQPPLPPPECPDGGYPNPPYPGPPGNRWDPQDPCRPPYPHDPCANYPPYPQIQPCQLQIEPGMPGNQEAQYAEKIEDVACNDNQQENPVQSQGHPIPSPLHPAKGQGL